jgi:hypothetical protein
MLDSLKVGLANDGYFNYLSHALTEISTLSINPLQSEPKFMSTNL